MKKQFIRNWDNNLKYLVNSLRNNLCRPEDESRHIHDFLKAYRDAIAEELKED